MTTRKPLYDDKTVPFRCDSEDDTELLLEDLKSRKLYSDFAREHEHHFKEDNFRAVFLSILASLGIEVKDVSDTVDVGRTYVYQIISGKRKPTRDKLIVIALGLELSLKTTNKLLVSAGKKELYVKNKRDSVILYGISHGFSVEDINVLLRREELLEL